ncbi:hypothetical protein [Micromonospora sp. NPDC023888]|uniref:hypothetical protein n=1 Tax=Micromonospora sp. NPDC023888 TaxID=3155607 RepID=UPI0033F7376A
MSPLAPKTCGPRLVPWNPASAQSGSDAVSTGEWQPVAALGLPTTLAVLATPAVVAVGAADPPPVAAVHPANRTTDAANGNLPQKPISTPPVRVDDSSHLQDTGRARQVP